MTDSISPEPDYSGVSHCLNEYIKVCVSMEILLADCCDGKHSNKYNDVDGP